VPDLWGNNGLQLAVAPTAKGGSDPALQSLWSVMIPRDDRGACGGVVDAGAAESLA